VRTPLARRRPRGRSMHRIVRATVPTALSFLLVASAVPAPGAPAGDSDARSSASPGRPALECWPKSFVIRDLRGVRVLHLPARICRELPRGHRG